MTDQYPENIEIDIERDALLKYLRTKWLCSWLLGLGVVGCLIGFATLTHRLDNHDYTGVLDVILILIRGVGLGLLISIPASITFYFLCSHRLAARISSNLRVTVEGAFALDNTQHNTRKEGRPNSRRNRNYPTRQGNHTRIGSIHENNHTTLHSGMRSWCIYGL
jgi:hypothetical protein